MMQGECLPLRGRFLVVIVPIAICLFTDGLVLDHDRLAFFHGFFGVVRIAVLIQRAGRANTSQVLTRTFHALFLRLGEVVHPQAFYQIKIAGERTIWEHTSTFVGFVTLRETPIVRIGCAVLIAFLTARGHRDNGEDQQEDADPSSPCRRAVARRRDMIFTRHTDLVAQIILLHGFSPFAAYGAVSRSAVRPPWVDGRRCRATAISASRGILAEFWFKATIITRPRRVDGCA